MLRFIKERKRAAASVGVITAAAVALGVVAFTHPGFTTTDVDMHDGGVWVTNLELNRVGHLNYQAQELDAGLNVPSENFDVVQNDGTVAVIDRMNLNLSPIDTGQASLSGVVPLPGDVDVTIRGGTATILDPADGRLWAFPADRIASFDFQEHDPLAVIGQGGAATADDGGGVHAVSSESGTVHSWQNTEEGFVAVSEEEREQLAEASDLQITSVGEEPVVLDAESGTLFLSNSVTTVPPNSQLQHPGVDRTHVAIASGSELIRQPLAGGEALVEEYASGGPAVAPVQVDGCVYGVWPGDSRVIRDCDDEQGNFDEVIDTAVSDDVVFREHRGVVALNDVVDGVSWLMTDELIMVDNWADLIPPTSEEDSDEIDEESMDDTFENVAPDPSEENNPPVAYDDTIFGARTGRSTLVPVLHNDSDPDGDILTVSLVGDAPDGVRISPVQNASQFQVEIPEDFSSSAVSFRYRVDDGRGGTDEASVTLPIRNASQNAAPEELREQGFEVEQRAQYEHGVLEHWFDPDGDDLFLMDAYSDSGDTVRFNPNGRIVYTATGEPGPTTMTIVVSDGVAETEETIDVEVRERGSSEPIANADYVSVGEGETVSVQPLANDFLPAGDDARLASASPRGDLEVEVDRSTNTLYVTGGAPGTHYVDYTVAAGPNQAQGHVRVDVTEPVEDATPVAVRDVALLPMGEEAIVDLTENDVDPTGGVLVVQSVETDGAPVSVQLLQRHMLRVQDQGGLTERTTLTYNVSNGSETATGEVVIIPVEPPDKPRSPVAVDDTATLREGDFTSIDITENDFSPDNVPFSVEAELVESSLLPEEGHVFVDGDELRVHVVAGGPSYVDVTYEISDEYGNADTASVRIEVEPRDLETNQDPHALEVSSRVLAGNVVRIPIPLNGIDPDGDGVTLVGWESAPDMGRIVEVGPDYIDYEAFSEDSGTTAFQYRVRDRWGAESVSTITIGVAQPGSMNQAPHAATDRVEVRPGRAVAVSVLDNDSDPDGDELSLTGVNTEDAPDGFDDLRTGDEAPTVNFTAPSEPGEYMLEYTIEDARGASAVGTIRVEVSDDAPLQPPEPVDDVVSVEDLTPGEPYVVPVLENDRDVDGDPAELLVDVLTGEGTVVEDGVQVVPGDEFQVITYRATDQDGGEGEAFIFVPAVGEELPYIAENTVLYVPSGEPLDISLADVVEMPSGGTPRITTEDTVSATNYNGDALVVDEHNLVYTSELGYVGDAAISFEVTDGSGPEDTDALTARLTVPIVVTSSSQVPPEFHGAELQVEAGEDPVEFDLTDVTWDPDPGDLEDMQFELIGGETPGIEAHIDGQTFVRSAEVDAEPGVLGVYEIEVQDPAGNVEHGTVTVEVVPSLRALPEAVNDSAETDQGVEVAVNVVENDFNPFQNMGEPLHVRDVRVLRGDAMGEPSTDGTNVMVTPGDDFSGVLTLQYTVEDATGSDERTAVGNVEVNVRGRPDAPLRPNVNTIGDSEVTLSWAAPSSNGAPITGYIVQWDGGSQECESTTCTVTGLANDTVYNFEVVAVNEVGESDPSPSSIDARPDVRPEQPDAPSADRGDGELAVSWEAPENRGSAIEYYVLQISPGAPDGTTQVEVESTNFTWEGLANGTEYRFSVQAHNNADEPSEWSRESAGEIPAGPPTAPSDVSATSQQLGGSTNQVAVSWGLSDDNGAAVEDYTIVPHRNGSPLSDLSRTVPAPSNSTTGTFTYESLPVHEDAYTFEVFATNDVGDGEATTSDPIRIVNAPDAPAVGHVEDGDEEAVISITPGELHGYRESEVSYEYRAGSGSWQSVGTGNQTISGLSNSQQTIEVRAVAETDGVSNTSDTSSVRVSPFGQPPSPSVSASASTSGVQFSWDVSGDNGRPIEGVDTRYRVNGGSWTDWQSRNNSNGSATVDGDPGQTIQMQVRTRAEGGPSDSESASGTVEDPSRLWLTAGDEQCADGQCGPRLVLNYEGVEPGTYEFRCWHSQDGYFVTGREVTLQSSGVALETGDPSCFNNYEGTARMELYQNNEMIYESEERSWPP